MYLPALPRIGAQLQGSASMVQLSLTALLAGLAAGQLVMGPLSDRLGRRKPLLVGVAGFVLTSLACALAPSVPMLVALRFMQGLAGSVGIVIARAVVRDLYDGAAAVRFFSRLMLVMGIAPIVAPVAGAQILQVMSWRGVFVVLAVLGLLVLATAAAGIPETCPPERRSRGGIGASAWSMVKMLRDRELVGYALASGFAFAAMFAYISASPFVVQNIYGGSPGSFSLIFALNSVGLIVSSQVNGWLAGRAAPRTVLAAGLGTTLVAGLGILAVVAAGLPQLWALVLGLFVLVSSMGFVMPNASVLALSGHPEAAGAASALLGVVQFAIGAVAAPLVGIAGDHSAIPMAVVITVLAVGAGASFVFLTERAEGDRSPRSAD
jgi:DHA1 family bicyclomycin/chloramphenicol resistance-like MFS transporter